MQVTSVSIKPNLIAVIRDPTCIATLPVGEIPELAAELAKLQALLLIRLTCSSQAPLPDLKSETDKWLTAEQAAPLLGVSVRWMYRHHKELPFSKRLTRKTLRFSEAGIRRYQANKRG